MSNKDDFDIWLNKKSQDDESSKDLNTEKVFETIENRENFYEQNRYTENNFEAKEYIDEKFSNFKPKLPIFAMFSLVLLGAILGSFIGPFASKLYNDKAVKNNSNQTINITNTEGVSVENAVAQKSIPSVVGIRVEFENRDSRFGLRMQGEGIGSGVIVSESGYILTNSHVLSTNANDITVLFSDNSTVDAKVVWQDQTLDLGIIKVEKENLQAIEFADSDNISIGDKAIAIGNPVGLNLQSTLTSGYISGLNRSIRMQNGLIMNGLIQTDASINSGNSGGALLNSKGQLIGINTAKAGNTDGIGFAIPSNVAKSIVEAVVERGNFTPVTLGVRGMDVLNYKQYYGENIPDDEGFLITEVIDDTAASKAGFQEGDVIKKIDDHNIQSMNKLKQVLLKYNPGDSAEILIHRNEREIKLKITFSKNTPDV